MPLRQAAVPAVLSKRAFFWDSCSASGLEGLQRRPDGGLLLQCFFQLFPPGIQLLHLALGLLQLRRQVLDLRPKAFIFLLQPLLLRSSFPGSFLYIIDNVLLGKPAEGDALKRCCSPLIHRFLPVDILGPL